MEQRKLPNLNKAVKAQGYAEPVVLFVGSQSQHRQTSLYSTILQCSTGDQSGDNSV